MKHRISALGVMAACLLMMLSAYFFHSANPALLKAGSKLNRDTLSGVRIGQLDQKPELHDQAYHLITNGRLTEALIALLLGGIALGVALRFSAPDPTFAALPVADTFSLRPRWRLAAAGAGLLILLIGIDGDLLGQVSIHVQFALLLGGIAALVGGLGGIRRPQWLRADTPPPPTPPPARGRGFKPRFSPFPLGGGWADRRSRDGGERSAHVIAREVGIVAGIAVLALALRVWHLESTIHVWVDEAHFAHAVSRIEEGENIRLLSPFSDVASFTWVFPYLQAAPVKLFGPGFATLRAASALIGVLTVLAVYGLGAALFDRKTAALAALILATLPPHIHFSRIGLNNIADPLFGTLALAFLARGIRHGRGLDYALGGAALGLTQYFYEGGRLLYPPLVLVWLGVVALNGRPRGFWRGVGLALLVAVMVALPVYVAQWGTGSRFADRMYSVGLGGPYWRALLTSTTGQGLLTIQTRNILYSVLYYVYLPDMSWFYAGSTPLLMGTMVPLFLLGVGGALWRWRHSGMSLLLIWVGATSLGNSTLVESASSPRFVVVFPALALLVAIGVRWVLPRGGPFARRQRLAKGLIAGLLAVLLSSQVLYYFGPQLDTFNDRIRENMFDGQDALLRSADFPPGTQVHLVSNYVMPSFNIETTLRFWNLDLYVEALTPEQFTAEHIAALPHQVNHAFFIEPEDTATLQRLQARFALDLPAYSPFNVPPSYQLVLYYAPRTK